LEDKINKFILIKKYFFKKKLNLTKTRKKMRQPLLFKKKDKSYRKKIKGMLEDEIVKKKELKKRKKQESLNKSCKPGLNSQTYNPLNSRSGINPEMQHPKN
jgi:hypothetical protein